MDDKRIKLITKEMFIAWGIICWVILLIDMEFWHLGRSVLYIIGHNTIKYPMYSGIAQMVINVSCIVSTLIVGILSDYIPKGTYLLYLISALQILIYWYLGKLAGEFIVWVKHFKNNSECFRKVFISLKLWVVTMKKWIPSKKNMLIFGIAFVVFFMLYGGSYWYLRDKTIQLEKQMDRNKKFVIPPGYYFEIVFGIGLGNRGEPGQSANICPFWVNAENKVEFKMWMVYFYYPLWRSEVAIWRMKTFGK